MPRGPRTDHSFWHRPGALALLWLLGPGPANAAPAVASRPQARVDTVAEVEFVAFRTYRWGSDQDRPGSALPERNPEADRALREAVERELGKRGLRPAEGEEAADLRLQYHVGSEERREWRTAEATAGRPGRPAGEIVQFTSGTLVLEVFTSEGDRLVWRGWVDEALAAPDHLRKTIRRAVRTLLRDFPSAGGRR